MALQDGIRGNSRGLTLASNVAEFSAYAMTPGAEALPAVNKGFENVVYQGIDNQGVVRYVGITARDVAERFTEHLEALGTGRELLDYHAIPGATNLPRIGARVWEQSLIIKYGLEKNGGQLLNKINSIAPKYWWRYGL